MNGTDYPLRAETLRFMELDAPNGTVGRKVDWKTVEVVTGQGDAWA